MRLPADAVLIVIDGFEGASASRGSPDAEAAVAALLAAWRSEGLPIVHAQSEGAKGDGSARVRPGEALTELRGRALLRGPASKRLCDAIGATTLVICGAPTPGAVEASVRDAGDLGYQVFVVADACWAEATRDPTGRLRPAEEAHAPFALTSQWTPCDDRRYGDHACRGPPRKGSATSRGQALIW